MKEKTKWDDFGSDRWAFSDGQIYYGAFADLRWVNFTSKQALVISRSINRKEKILGDEDETKI